MTTVRLGVPLCSIPLEKFSGEVKSDLFIGARGQVFISPALLVANTGNNIDVNFLQTRVIASDVYRRMQFPNPRPFLLGPYLSEAPARIFPPNMSDPDYMPTLTNSVFALINNKPRVKGTLHDTMSGITTIIVY